jgi:hypothetical protein
MNTKTVEQVLGQVANLQREHAEALERLAWSFDHKGFSIEVGRANGTRLRLQAARELLKLLADHPELDPLHGMVHPGAM